MFNFLKPNRKNEDSSSKEDCPFLKEKEKKPEELNISMPPGH
jgi:hypothetical protein